LRHTRGFEGGLILANSQNGWAAGDTGVLDRNFTVAGVTFPGGVRRGDVSVVLRYVAEQVNARVEPLVAGWCWGYNYRPVTGGGSLSNHSSGTAIDVNAPDHPYGKRDTFTPEQRAVIRQILAEVGGAVRWGGDYSGNRDDMHFEINVSAAEVANVAARLPASASQAPEPEEEEPMIVPASTDNYVSVPCNGKTLLFVSTGFGRTVQILGIAAVKDNNGKGTPEYTGVQEGLKDINPDQPGPISIGGGCRVVQLRYSADHDFTVWCA
jgi:hypothetical protein